MHIVPEFMLSCDPDGKAKKPRDPIPDDFELREQNPQLPATGNA